jgi:SAM-dependent methyltransferase
MLGTMSHREQVDFFTSVYNKYPEAFDSKKVLEIGSLIINGSLRDIFNKTKEYVGVDLGAGPGVDVVCKGHEVNYSNDYFDAAISAECFEHDEFWDLTFQKMIDVTKPQGMIVFSCATTGRPEHGTHQTDAGSSPFTQHYYKNLTEIDFREKFDISNIFQKFEFIGERNHHDLYFWGQLF